MSAYGPLTPTPVAGDAPTQRVPVTGGGDRGPDRLGPYKLVHVLGEGGMGVVHLGVDPRGRAVAVKVLRDHIAQDSGSRARLAREVSSLSRVRHERVAPVLDADTTGPRPYVVTRFVPGPGLDEVVRDGGPFRGAALVALGEGLAEALEAIHAAGIVHRDLKPGNVLMVDDGPVVIDFGIAHVGDDTRLTSTGLVMGTPGYLSPEVVSGGVVTPATDWWGWAATMAFAATGRPPFGRGPMHVVLDRVRAGDADLDGLEPGLQRLFERALTPTTARRPSPRELLSGLRAYGERVADRPETVAQPVRDTAVLPVAEREAERTRPQPVRPPAAPWQQTASRAAAPDEPAPYATIGRTGSSRPARDGVLPRRTERRPHPTGLPYDRPAPVPSDTTPYAGESPPAPTGSTAYPAPRPASAQQLGDPRLGRPGRTGALTALALALAATAATWPFIALCVAVVWAALARTSDRVVTATVVRRHTYGSVRRSDGFVAALTSPLHLVTALLSTLLSGVLAAAVGVSVAFLVSVIGSALFAWNLSTWGAPALPLGALAGLWTTWWGPGGRSLRRGSRSLMRTLTPEGLGADLVTSSLMVAAVGLALWSAVSHGVPVWAPYGPPTGPSPVPWQW